jgi:hypothetical protein
MNILCPRCLATLPPGYPHDHVAIDRAVAGDPLIFARMTADEQREVIATALSRGVSLSALQSQLRVGWDRLQALALVSPGGEGGN